MPIASPPRWLVPLRGSNATKPGRMSQAAIRGNHILGLTERGFESRMFLYGASGAVSAVPTIVPTPYQQLGDYLQNRSMPKVDFREEVVNVALAELLEQRGLSEGNVVDGKVTRYGR